MCNQGGKQQTIVIYTRISTDKQNHESQLSDLREYLAPGAAGKM
jgi:DNA invertase Pin-like site-specific DNA recombinase